MFYMCRIMEVQDELEQYTILENAIFIPISAKIGTNLDILKKNIVDVVQKHQEKEKIRISEIEKEKEKMKNRIFLERKLEIEKEKERKALGGLCAALETVKDDNNWNEYQDDNHNHSSSSNGVLLDIIKSRKLGTTLHVVIKEGEVRITVIIIIASYTMISLIDLIQLYHTYPTLSYPPLHSTPFLVTPRTASLHPH
jgi:hypothetical protein